MVAAESPDSVIDEVDLELINALQVTPRGSWAVLGRALDLDPATAARRWQRLTETGLAWVTCIIGPARHHEFCMAYIKVSVAPGWFDSVAAALIEEPSAPYLHHITGPSPLLLVIALRNPAAVSDFLRDVLGQLPGVTSYHAEIRTVGYTEPSRWRLDSLDPVRRGRLPPTAGESRGTTVDETDRALYRLLHIDGRMSFTELAGRVGISEATARRRVNRLLDTRHLRLRCDMAQSVSGWPITGVLWARVPPGSLDQVARSLGNRAEVRLSCALSGPANLLLMVWLRTLEGLAEFERVVGELHPELSIVDRSVCLHTMKQMWRQLDSTGRAIRVLDLNRVSFPGT
ncbi:DNA-binding Lrp family transcriptional regulator [Tamaricihabitans halophyticus]|uniref:DNA-binding Lrp family transcriptional regulator n=1 Tax=Tamaricihabitans halophyticus TaxID=1262583 RepID=A0A4V6NR45_9PSEU|nr:AsnC family transcriptional regulator [Tamaricihabitans halophyticus]TCP45066.1 DNA-binding Lrp family transcriptional regulator [Tamaricihabitans halophyticus]